MSVIAAIVYCVLLYLIFFVLALTVHTLCYLLLEPYPNWDDYKTLMYAVWHTMFRPIKTIRDIRRWRREERGDE